MTSNRKVVAIGLLLCVAGAWLVFRASASTIALANEADPGGVLSSEQITDPDAVQSSSATGAEGEAATDRNDSSDLGASADGEVAMGAELDSLSLQRITTPTTVEPDSICDRDYAGLGVEMRAWGDVLIPYTPGYPTTDPGEVWDCTADTVFGGAIAMAHAAYLDALRPDLIPLIALDSPGRDLRINGHPGPNSTASLGFLCSPIGWNWDGDSTWSLLHQCGDGGLQVSYYPMEHRDGRWWLVYPRTGQVETGPPPTTYEYYAFLGGD